MNMKDELSKLLEKTGQGVVSSSAYDTAWLARLGKIDATMSQQALNWLRQNQLEDGSWGTKIPLSYYDRIVCTLAAVITLAKLGDPLDEERLEAAKTFLQTAFNCLSSDRIGETAGFEIIVPTLLEEAQELNIGTLNHDFVEELLLVRQRKLSKAPGKMISRFTNMAYSAEMVRADELQLLDVENLQEPDGSIGTSPAATAFYLINVKPDDQGLAYLKNTALKGDGSVPNVAPIDTFERAWVLWNLALIGANQDTQLGKLIKTHLDSLAENWNRKGGSGFSSNYTVNNGDDTAVTYIVLKHYGYDVDIESVLKYAEDSYYRCFEVEANYSLSTNVHVLGALKTAGFPKTHSEVQKVLRFLKQTRSSNNFWSDKWHVSPFYTTSHAVTIMADYEETLALEAVDWILKMQKVDGSWGYFGSTTEETAYALQALLVWKSHGHYVPEYVLHKAAVWLYHHQNDPYTPLWIGKSIYTPEVVVNSVILSALQLYEMSQNKTAVIAVSRYNKQCNSGHFALSS